MLVARGVVFGIMVGTMTLVVSIPLFIAVVRLLDVYAFPGRVWAADALVGGLLAPGAGWPCGGSGPGPAGGRADRDP